MGRTSKQLHIHVFYPLGDWEELDDLSRQGHVITHGDDNVVVRADIILGPQCWRMNEELRPYLKLAIEEARRLKYGPTKPRDEPSEYEGDED